MKSPESKITTLDPEAFKREIERLRAEMLAKLADLPAFQPARVQTKSTKPN